MFQHYLFRTNVLQQIANERWFLDFCFLLCAIHGPSTTISLLMLFMCMWFISTCHAQWVLSSMADIKEITRLYGKEWWVISCPHQMILRNETGIKQWTFIGLTVLFNMYIKQPFFLINVVSVSSEASVQTVQATCASTIIFTYTDKKVETETITITATPSYCVQSRLADNKTETETITISHTLTNECLNQSLKCERSSTVWIALATFFLVMAISAIVLSILMGCILRRKMKTLENSSTCITVSSSDTNDPIKEGTVSHVN